MDFPLTEFQIVPSESSSVSVNFLMKPTQPSFQFEEDVSTDDLCREQVTRDEAVLLEDPIYHVPSRAFYEERIALFTQDAQRAIDHPCRSTTETPR